MILPDLLAPKLELVICGTAPSRTSKIAGAYYAHPGNIFWKTLFQCGLTPRLLNPHQYPELLASRIGLTDLNKTEAGADSELSDARFLIDDFKTKMLHFRPRLIAFESKSAAAKYFNRPIIRYGMQPETLEEIILFVLPSTSGRARRYFNLDDWQTVAHLAQTLP